MHPVEQFRAALAATPDEDFPDCLERVDLAELEPAAGGPVGVAAFPVSHGLYADPGRDHRRLPDFPAPGQGLMIVGDHPPSREGALTQLRENGAHGDPSLGPRLMRYWRELYRLLDAAGIDRHSIFATNIHPAYFTKTSGRVPRRHNTAWFEHARGLLLQEIRTMRPRVLLALGRVAADELRRVDINLPPLTLNVPISVDLDGTPTTILLARHPSAPGTTHEMRDRRVDALSHAWSSPAAPGLTAAPDRPHTIGSVSRPHSAGPRHPLRR